jgi:hypothetical protein
MKIQVTLNVPDGDTCEGCDLWWRAEDKRCYCLAFGMKELEGRYRKNMVSGVDIIKCQECILSMVPD